MFESHLSIFLKKNLPRVEIEVKTGSDQKILDLSYSFKNTTGEPIFVFYSNPPFVRIGLNCQIEFMSLMPILTPWMRVIAPHIPRVLRLDVNQLNTGKACYKLPLIDSHPYPAGPIMTVPIPIEEEKSAQVQMTIGYFPESDGNRLFDSVNLCEKVPGYYDLKRQFLVSSKPIMLSVRVLRPLWGEINEEK